MTTAPDFRALCAELVDELNYHADEHSVDELIARTRTALEATPPPEPPTDDFLKSYPEVTRVEVITNNGREFVRYECSTVQVSFQDEGQTIKVFLFSTYD